MKSTDDYFDRALVTRFTIRVTARQPWDCSGRWAAMVKFDGLLNKLLQDNSLDIRDRTRGQTIVGLAVHCAAQQTPVDGRKASDQGFLREENPFPRGTRKHNAWDKAWVEDDKWAARP